MITAFTFNLYKEVAHIHQELISISVVINALHAKPVTPISAHHASHNFPISDSSVL